MIIFQMAPAYYIFFQPAPAPTYHLPAPALDDWSVWKNINVKLQKLQEK